jgi:PAS domain S-box-containing protein
VSFWLVDDAARTIRIAAWSDPTMGAGFPQRLRSFGEGAIGRIAETGEPVHVPDVFAPDSLVTSRRWWERHHLRSFYGTPVILDGRVLAVLALNGRAPFVLSEEDQELLASLVAQAAVAIRNARLFEQAEARRRAAEAAEARYRQLFERNLAGILRTTADGRIIDCNDALVAILGYETREALMARAAVDLYVDPATHAAVVALLVSGGRLANVELPWRRADASAVTVLVNIAAVEDPVEGHILDGIIIDITDRDRLAAVEREAETLRAVARLANGAAHEINNPLAVIVGHLTILEQRLGSDPAIRQRLEKARAACTRISEMIANMRQITRLELRQEAPGLPPIIDLRRSSEESGP